MRALLGCFVAGGVLLVGIARLSSSPTASAGPTAPTAPAAIPADEVPRGMVAFIDGPMCPPGWVATPLVAGRMLVGTDRVAVIGRQVGEQLMAEEDRGHVHELTGATIALPYKSISGADGGNQQGAGAGDQAVTGTVAAAASGLPFIQLVACVAP